MLSFSEIEPLDKTEPLDEQLLKALGTATASDTQVRNSEAFTIYLEYAPSLNDRNQVGVAKTIEAHSNIGKSAQDTLWTSFARFLTRTEFRHTQDKMRQSLKPVMDGVLSRTWSRMHKNGVGLETFISTHRQLLGICWNSTDLAAVAACGGVWSSVLDQVRRISDASSVGALCFGSVMSAANSKGLAKQLQTSLASLSLDKLTLSGLKAWRMELTKDLRQYTDGDVLDEKRVVEVPFAKGVVPMTVHTAELEIEFRVSAFIKEAAIGAENGLPLLEWEQWLRLPILA